MEFRIKEAREKANIEQRVLAQKLGISPSTLSGYESGKHDPKSENLSQIADICGVSVDYLLGRESEAVLPSPAPMEQLEALVNQLTEEQACFMVQVVEAILRKNPKAYAAAREENRRLWEGE